MQTYPLKSLTLEQATQMQFALIDEITKVFKGQEILTRGDLGVVLGYNQPITTHKVETVLASFFKADQALLVRGAGTMAIRLALYACLKPNDTILIHDASIYPTTLTSFKMMNLTCVKADFNDLNALKEVLLNNEINGALIQVTRQKPDDSYDLQTVISLIKEFKPDLPIITDDNYAIMKTGVDGVKAGATIACFSTFKLLGPEGVGCLIGAKKYLEQIKQENYSGGLQVQGHESLDVLRGLVYAPVMLAISANVVEKTKQLLNDGVVNGVKQAFIANAQSKVLIVELIDDNAMDVIKEASLLGAAPNPIGAESKYEFVPMFYKVSNTFSKSYAQANTKWIRINPMRGGSDTIIRILQQAIINAKEKNNG
ncbi:MAG: aminotransferase class V-fold PLP-dependent enzyme [Bacilli bacterium]